MKAWGRGGRGLTSSGLRDRSWTLCTLTLRALFCFVVCDAVYFFRSFGGLVRFCCMFCWGGVLRTAVSLEGGVRISPSLDT